MTYCVIAKQWCSCVCVGEVTVNMKPKQHQLMWSQQCFQEYFTSSVTHDIITVSTMNVLSAGRLYWPASSSKIVNLEVLAMSLLSVIHLCLLTLCCYETKFGLIECY
jgi:hypothetical protein